MQILFQRWYVAVTRQTFNASPKTEYFIITFIRQESPFFDGGNIKKKKKIANPGL